MADFQGGTMGALLYVATSSQTISNSAAATSLTGSTVPANGVNVGSTISQEWAGVLSSKSSSPGTLAVAVMVGGTAILTTTSATLVTSLSTIPVFGVSNVTVRSIGATGTGIASFFMRAVSEQAGVTDFLVQGCDTTADTIDWTVANAVTMRFTFSVADTTNILVITEHRIAIK